MNSLFCSNCGTQIQTGASFCSGCGRSLGSSGSFGSHGSPDLTCESAPPVKKKSRWFRNLLIIAAAILLLSLLFGDDDFEMSDDEALVEDSSEASSAIFYDNSGSLSSAPYASPSTFGSSGSSGLSSLSYGFSSRNAGNASVLTGDIFIYKIWIGDPQWSQSERQKIDRKFKASLSWFKQQAARYGKTVNFIEEDVAFAGRIASGINGAYETDASAFLRQASGKNEAQMEAYAKSKGCSSWLPIFFANHAGVSYAPAWAQKGHADMEFIVIAKLGYPSMIETPVSACVHEMLHAFGARDYYQCGSVSAEQAALIEKMFPNEIMNAIDLRHDISRFNLSGLTAFLVGWNDNWNNQWNALTPLWHFEEDLVRRISASNRRSRTVEVVMNNKSNKPINFALLYAAQAGFFSNPRLFKQGWWTVPANETTTVRLDDVVPQILGGIGYYVTAQGGGKLDATGVKNGSAGLFSITNNTFNDHVTRTYSNQYAANFALAKSGGNTFKITINN